MLTAKQGCGRRGGNKPTPARQARSRKGPRERQAEGASWTPLPVHGGGSKPVPPVQASERGVTQTLSCRLGARDVLGSLRPLCSAGGETLGPKSPQLQRGSACSAGDTGGGTAASWEGRQNTWGWRPKGAPERATLPANEVGACERARAENPRRTHQAPCPR